MHQWGFAWQDGTLIRRQWRPAAMAARLVRPSHCGAGAGRHGGHAGATADAPPARRAWATGVLVAGAPGARYCRLHGWPGQARDRRIRPGRGHLPVLVLTACAVGLLATLFTAVSPRKPGRQRSALRHRTSRPKPPKPGIPIRGAYQMAGAPASSRYSKGVSSTRPPRPALLGVGLPAPLVRTFGPFPAGASA